MATYLFAYHGGSTPQTEPEMEAVMAAWGAWMGSLGERLVDGGAPTNSLATVGTTGVSDDGGPNPITGYSFFAADDLEAAIKAAQDCPILEAGGSVEVAEVVAM